MNALASLFIRTFIKLHESPLELDEQKVNNFNGLYAALVGSKASLEADQLASLSPETQEKFCKVLVNTRPFESVDLPYAGSNDLRLMLNVYSPDQFREVLAGRILAEVNGLDLRLRTLASEILPLLGEAKYPEAFVACNTKEEFLANLKALKEKLGEGKKELKDFFQSLHNNYYNLTVDLKNELKELFPGYEQFEPEEEPEEEEEEEPKKPTDQPPEKPENPAEEDGDEDGDEDDDAFNFEDDDLDLDLDKDDDEEEPDEAEEPLFQPSEEEDPVQVNGGCGGKKPAETDSGDMPAPMGIAKFDKPAEQPKEDDDEEDDDEEEPEDGEEDDSEEDVIHYSAGAREALKRNKTNLNNSRSVKETRILVDYENAADEWWAAAFARKSSAPKEIRPLLKVGGPSFVEVSKSIATGILHWAEKLPGWESGPDYASNPLIFQEAVREDVSMDLMKDAGRINDPKTGKPGPRPIEQDADDKDKKDEEPGEKKPEEPEKGKEAPKEKKRKRNEARVNNSVYLTSQDIRDLTDNGALNSAPSDLAGIERDLGAHGFKSASVSDSMGGVDVELQNKNLVKAFVSFLKKNGVAVYESTPGKWRSLRESKQQGLTFTLGLHDLVILTDAYGTETIENVLAANDLRPRKIVNTGKVIKVTFINQGDANTFGDLLRSLDLEESFSTDPQAAANNYSQAAAINDPKTGKPFPAEQEGPCPKCGEDPCICPKEVDEEPPIVPAERKNKRTEDISDVDDLVDSFETLRDVLNAVKVDSVRHYGGVYFRAAADLTQRIDRLIKIFSGIRESAGISRSKKNLKENVISISVKDIPDDASIAEIADEISAIFRRKNLRFTDYYDPKHKKHVWKGDMDDIDFDRAIHSVEKLLDLEPGLTSFNPEVIESADTSRSKKTKVNECEDLDYSFPDGKSAEQFANAIRKDFDVSVAVKNEDDDWLVTVDGWELADYISDKLKDVAKKFSGNEAD